MCKWRSFGSEISSHDLRRVPDGVGREDEGTSGEESNGEEELGNERAGSGLGDLVGLEERVGDGLLDTHAGALLVVEDTEGEGEGTGLLLDLGEGGTRGLHLELVVDVRGALVDGGARVLGAGLQC